MAAYTWPGAELVSARRTQQMARRQRRALAALTVVAGSAALVAAPAGSFLIAASTLALAGTVIVSVVGAVVRDRGDRSADALIEAGFGWQRRADAVSRAVAARVRELESLRHRRGLAKALRADLELARAAPTLTSVRCSAVPPIRGLASHADAVERIAVAVERCPSCDPRALIALGRLITTPGSRVGAGDEPSAEAAVGSELGRIERLLGSAP